MSITKEYSLSLSLDAEKVVTATEQIEFVTGDKNCCILNITLKKNQLPADITGNTVQLNIQKPDGNVVIQDSVNSPDTVQIIDAATGQIKIILEDQSITGVGRNFADITLIDGVDRTTSSEFKFYVRANKDSDEAIQSSSIVSYLQAIIAAYELATHDNTVVELADAKHDNVTNEDFNDIGDRMDNHSSQLSDAKHDNVTGEDFASIGARMDSSSSQLAEIKKKSIHGDKFISTNAYPRIVPEITDQPRLIRAINDTPVGGTLILSESLYEINATITITKSVHILGFDAVLQTVTNGMDIILNFDTVDNFSITSIKFDQALKGRTSIQVTHCNDFIIDKCYFTRYSKEYGYYQTDGGIRINDSTNGIISSNRWFEHGNQYGTALTELNRCITIQANSDKIIIIGNRFEKVNQGIAIGSGSHDIAGNIFEEVHDNSLYLIGVDTVNITGNTFNDKYDECIVFDGANINITGNTFKNVPNKVFAVNGPTTHVNISGNIIDNSGIESGQFIVWRYFSDTVTKMIVSSNTFKQTTNINSYEYFGFGNIICLHFNNNIIDVVTQDYQRILYFGGTSANGEIKNNTITGTYSTSKAIEVSAGITSPNIVFESNELSGCRGIASGLIIKDQTVQFNVGPYILNRPESSVIWASEVPTIGSWEKEDICYNTNTTELGTAGSKYIIQGWKCIAGGTPGTWVQMRALTGN